MSAYKKKKIAFLIELCVHGWFLREVVCKVISYYVVCYDVIWLTNSAMDWTSIWMNNLDSLKMSPTRKKCSYTHFAIDTLKPNHITPQQTTSYPISLHTADLSQSPYITINDERQ